MTTLIDAYKAIMAAGDAARAGNDCTPVQSAISQANMKACAAEDDKFTDFNTSYELVAGDERLLVQYRWYDTSKAFSMRPDMNIYRLRHTCAGKVVAQDEIRFLGRT